MQSAKILDITRSFVPVDPNAYPENLHAVGAEDDPERRVPIVPYIGYNFLPTAYGYKSFFGTNAALDINTLAPNKPDYVFIFQNLAYQNVVIALCDTGIWAKAADAVGPWTQLVAKAVPADNVFYEWYFVTIKNKLYCFRANDTAFYKIDTNIGQPLGIDCTAIVPNFITITAQLGMFKLGARLGFWDAENAVAYCSPDDFSDFTPSVLTGANVTTFNSVVGKISNIRSHGNNAIIYASKSITGLMIQPGETFFVKAIPILQGVGVPYARQSIASVPDNTHFAYTSGGIYKITDGNPEVIVPEVYDYFKEYTAQPIYLHLLQSRFLCFEILDQNLINGRPLFSTGHIPQGSVTFPGFTSLDSIHSASHDTIDVCQIAGMVSDGTLDEQQAQANSDIPDNDKKDGTFATPLYTAYLSRNGVIDPSNLNWTSPCGGVGPNGTIFDMNPVASGNKIGSLTTDGTNKTASYGPDAYTDGHWTIQRFVQTQTAIWEAEEKAIEAFLNEVKNRAFAETKTTPNSTSCVVSNPADYSYCDNGEYVKSFSAPKFGFNKCSFWLTRYCLETELIQTRSKLTVACDAGFQDNWPISDYFLSTNGNYWQGPFASVAAAEAALSTPGNTYKAEYAAIATLTGPFASTGGGGYSVGVPVGTNFTYSAAAIFRKLEDGTVHATAGLQIRWIAPAGKTLGQTAAGTATVRPVVNVSYLAGHADKIENYTIANVSGGVNVGVLGVETAYCLLTHWKYTAKDGTTKIVPASACTITDDSYPGSTTGTTQRAVPSDDLRPVITATDGNFCGMPYDPPNIGDFSGIDWPEQTVVYPTASFLLQDGGIAPKYPTIYGFFCYDLHLKKWGKAKFDYKQLLDYSPINSESASPISFANFGILAGAVKEDGFIYIFDDAPADSLITWGKLGYYRLGMTDVQEIRFDFKVPSTGDLVIDVSLDGQQIIDELSETESFTNVHQVIVYPKYNGKWFNISLTGQFDISFAEVKILKKGRR